MAPRSCVCASGPKSFFCNPADIRASIEKRFLVVIRRSRQRRLCLDMAGRADIECGHIWYELAKALSMGERIAKFQIGQVVRHRVFPFRGVIFDVDPDLQQHRGVVPGDSGGDPAAQGSAVLSPAGRERGVLLRRLCVGAESADRRQRRAGRAPPGRRHVRPAAGRHLSRAPQPPAELAPRAGSALLGAVPSAPGRLVNRRPIALTAC